MNKPGAILVLLALVAAFALARGASASPPPSVDEVAIDVEVVGNEANSLGTTESCNTSQIDVGDTFDIDVVVRGVPADPRLFGIGFNLLFDPAILRVDDVHLNEEPSLMAGDLLFGKVDYNVDLASNSPPGATGNVRIDWVQYSENFPPETGDGVLLRVTVTAVGEGISPILFGGFNYPQGVRDDDPGVIWIDDGIGDVYTIGSVYEAAIVVGSESCPASPPTTIPTTTPSPPHSATPTPTPGPPLDGSVEELAIDTEISGNTAGVLGDTDACNPDPLGIGEQRDVDLFIRGLPENPRLEAFDIDFTFDPAILRVDQIIYLETPAMLAPIKNRVSGYVDYDNRQGVIDPPPSTSGSILMSVGITSGDLGRPKGDGILARITVTGVGAGAGEIALEPEFIHPPVPEPFEFDEVGAGIVLVGAGSTCPVSVTSTATPTPPPTPSTAPTLTLSPTPTIAADPGTATPTKTKVQPSALPPTGGGSPGGSVIAPWLVAFAIVGMCGGWYVVARTRR